MTRAPPLAARLTVSVAESRSIDGQIEGGGQSLAFGRLRLDRHGLAVLRQRVDPDDAAERLLHG